MTRYHCLKEVATGFWNIRTPLNMIGGVLMNIENQMSLIKLSSGKFLAIDACELTTASKAMIDDLTEKGSLIEALVATHPFHSLFLLPFFKAYPNVKYYGAPRHLRRIKEINWAGDISEEENMKRWESEGVQMRYPDGAEFKNPPENNHFSGLFVFHAPSRTIHIDDTVFYFDDPGVGIWLLGGKKGRMSFHPGMEGAFTHSDDPEKFRSWMERLLHDWDFDNICTAHAGNKIGGAKEQLAETIAHYEPTFKKITAKLLKKEAAAAVAPSAAAPAAAPAETHPQTAAAMEVQSEAAAVVQSEAVAGEPAPTSLPAPSTPAPTAENAAPAAAPSAAPSAGADEGVGAGSGDGAAAGTAEAEAEAVGEPAAESAAEGDGK